MRYSTATLIFVAGVPATVKDELLTWNGAYSLDDAVQIDEEDLGTMLETNDISKETRGIVTDALTKNNGHVYQFV